MRSFAATLFPPCDPVVAIHDTSEESDAAVRLLGRAGYPSRMLKVVAGEGVDRRAAHPPTTRPTRDLPSSGAFWGVLWVALAMAGAASVARGLVAPGAMLVIGALVLAVQTAMLQSSVAPEAVTRATWHGPAPSELPYAGKLAENKILLLVSGSRSDIALARSLLRMQEASVSVA